MEEEIETSETQQTPIEIAKAKNSYYASLSDEVGVETKKKKIVSNEEFIRTWNQSAYVKDVAESLGISANSARARANKLRKIFAQAGISIQLKKHPRHSVRRKSLVDDVDELKRLANIAKQSLINRTEVPTERPEE